MSFEIIKVNNLLYNYLRLNNSVNIFTLKKMHILFTLT